MLEAPAKFQFGNAAIDNVSFQEAVEIILAYAVSMECHFVVTPNADHIVQLESDREFQKIYMAADLVVADGKPLMWASKMLSEPLKAKISGSDLMPKLCDAAAKNGLKIFLLGAPEGVAAVAAEKLRFRHKGIKIAGVYSPPFGFEKSEAERRKIITMINASQAHIVFVGLGAPKQERWMFENKEFLRAGVLLGVGASIEFAAGTVKRAPVFYQKAGLEWFYRLLQDPWRLAPRYLRDFKIFAIMVRDYFKRLRLRKFKLRRKP